MLTSEQLPTVGLRLGRSQKIFSQYKYEGLFRSNLYNGNRHTAQLLYDTLGWKVDAIMGLLEAKSLLYNTRFLRPAINLERVVIKKGNWRLGWSYFEDRNETRDKISDTLSPVSFIQDKMSFYIKNDPEANTYLYGGYSKETPKIPKGNQFEILEKAAEWNVGGHFHQWKDFKLGYTIKQRDVESFNPQNPERSSNLLGRLDVKADLIKKAFKWAAGYEIGNGQEPKVEYKYVKVQKGEGIYTWVDDGDGVEELNEFEQAPFADQGEYIRLSVFNNDFVRTRALNLQQTINVDLKNLVTKGLLPKIAALSTYQLSRKIREDMDSPFWNPFYRQYADTSVLANSSTWRNILYWNRSSPRYDIQLGYVKQDNQVLQTSGFEIRESDDLTLRSRISLQKKMDMVLNLRNGIKENRSQNFSTRNYKIRQLEAGPELNVILKDKLRFTGTYQYLSQENLDGNEDFSSNKLSLEGVWRKTNTTDFRVQVSLVQVEYVSAGNLNVDFVMLQGLQNGTNILWSAQFNTRLNKTLILTLQYNGRQTGEEKTIHTGTAQVRASF